MKTNSPADELPPLGYEEINYDELVQRVDYDFGLSRRSFAKILGAGLLIAISLPPAHAMSRPASIWARTASSRC